MIGRFLCLLGFHPLWTNVYGPSEHLWACVRCRRRKWDDSV